MRLITIIWWYNLPALYTSTFFSANAQANISGTAGGGRMSSNVRKEKRWYRGELEVGGGGETGGSELPLPALLVSTPFRSSSRLCVLFLLRNIVQILRNVYHFSRLRPLWISHFPPSLLPPPVDFPPPLTPGLPPPCPAPLEGTEKNEVSDVTWQ